jgi:DNA polymerase-3 subunit gamma/tau
VTSGADTYVFLQDLLEMIRNLLFVKIGGQETAQLVEAADSELDTLRKLSAHGSEEDLHLLFDMTLKGLQDLSRSPDPQLVFEMILLRLVMAPQVQSLQQLLQGAPSAGPYRVPIPTRQDSAPVNGARPTHSTPPSAPQARGPLPSAASPTTLSTAAAVPELAPPDSETGNATAEHWFQLVQKMKRVEPLLGAKVENLIFMGCEGKVLRLGIPFKMQFLREQMSDPQAIKKIKTHIDQNWGPGYSMELKVTGANETEKGLSAQALSQQKEQSRQDDIRSKVEQHPLVRSAKDAFKAQIKSIKETT